MFKNATQIEDTQPPQGLHVPSLYVPYQSHVLIDAADVKAFYNKLEEVRKLLPDGEKHYLKKDREIAELEHPNAHLIGIKDEFGNLVAGVMAMMPVSRMIAKKYPDYPFDANAEGTALLSGLWTDANHRGKGLAVQNIQMVLDLAKAKGLSNVLTGVAEGNPVLASFKRATENADKKFTHVGSYVRPALGDQPAYTMNFHRVTFFTPKRTPV